MGKTIQDGTASFEIRDIRIKALVDLFFPVGTIISRDDDVEPEIVKYGKWEKIAEGRVLQGAGGGYSVGENVDAGLPNITGQMPYPLSVDFNKDYPKNNNALYRSGTDDNTREYGSSADGDTLYFDASKSNPIYGASDTVQPAAHIVVHWKRVE